jgi:hypothetical protein
MRRGRGRRNAGNDFRARSGGNYFDSISISTRCIRSDHPVSRTGRSGAGYGAGNHAGSNASTGRYSDSTKRTPRRTCKRQRRRIERSGNVCPSR